MMCGMTDQLFASSGFAPEVLLKSVSGTTLSLSRVPAFLRTLLTADGTVTKSLESFFWEKVNVEAVHQTQRLVEEGDRFYLNIDLKDSVLVRDVELRGENSRMQYLSAHSVFAIKHLPPDIFSDLMSKNIGIGELLRECGLETYRKIVAMGLTDGSDSVQNQSIWRVYLIFIKGQAAIQIKEVFPLKMFVDS